ncbi:hypothetical protein R5R35_014472 [Gryllus longicercus]|uniref:Uncharacterized protein n=1 Tax=Gryllus longicercus TaxID=2509291 RepID=A0AAN9YXU0_9ORTH
MFLSPAAAAAAQLRAVSRRARASHVAACPAGAAGPGGPRQSGAPAPSGAALHFLPAAAPPRAAPRRGDLCARIMHNETLSLLVWLYLTFPLSRSVDFSFSFIFFRTLLLLYFRFAFSHVINTIC